MATFVSPCLQDFVDANCFHTCCNSNPFNSSSCLCKTDKHKIKLRDRDFRLGESSMFQKLHTFVLLNCSTSTTRPDHTETTNRIQSTSNLLLLLNILCFRSSLFCSIRVVDCKISDDIIGSPKKKGDDIIGWVRF